MRQRERARDKDRVNALFASYVRFSTSASSVAFSVQISSSFAHLRTFVSDPRLTPRGIGLSQRYLTNPSTSIFTDTRATWELSIAWSFYESVDERDLREEMKNERNTHETFFVAFKVCICDEFFDSCEKTRQSRHFLSLGSAEVFFKWQTPLYRVQSCIYTKGCEPETDASVGKGTEKGERRSSQSSKRLRITASESFASNMVARVRVNSFARGWAGASGLGGWRETKGRRVDGDDPQSFASFCWCLFGSVIKSPNDRP